MLHLWLLKSSAYYKISMPFNCKFISLYNNQVGIVMEQNYTIAWTIEGDVYPIADDPTQSPTHEAILFHPTLRDTFVIILRDIAHNRSWIVVDEFTSGICTNTCEFFCTLKRTITRSSLNSISGQLMKTDYILYAGLTVTFWTVIMLVSSTMKKVHSFTICFYIMSMRRHS
jgi:hypothetical protein